MAVRAGVGAVMTLAWALGAAAGCDTPPLPAVPDGKDAAGDAGADALGAVDTATGADVDRTVSVAVGPAACCLAMGDGVAVWADEGDLWRVQPLTGAKTLLVDAAGDPKDPTLSGGLVVWADDRGGDYDLWAMDLTGGAPYLLVGGEGDQDQPWLDGRRLVWIGRDAAPHSATEAEVWVMDLDEPSSRRQLTHDGVEQSHPAVSGDRVVWADFTNASAGRNREDADPGANDADILGYDLAADAAFVVTTDPGEQLRPSIDGDEVAWLERRRSSPDAPGSDLRVYVKRVGDAGARLLAKARWDGPDPGQRPSISGGVVAWVAAPPEAATGAFTTAVFAASFEGGEPWTVEESSSVLRAVVLGQGQAAWLGEGVVAIRPLVLPSGP